MSASHNAIFIRTMRDFSEPDIPEVGEDWFRKARLVRPRRLKNGGLSRPARTPPGQSGLGGKLRALADVIGLRPAAERFAEDQAITQAWIEQQLQRKGTPMAKNEPDPWWMEPPVISALHIVRQAAWHEQQAAALRASGDQLRAQCHAAAVEILERVAGEYTPSGRCPCCWWAFGSHEPDCERAPMFRRAA